MLDGLQSASATAGSVLDRSQLDRSISALSSRIFLLHNIHQDRPVIFQTRWAMSYLRGPLTRPQVRELMAKKKAQMAASIGVATREAVIPIAQEKAAPAATVAVPTGYSHTPPTLPHDLPQVFLPVRLSPSGAITVLEKNQGRRVEAIESTLVYEPALVALGRVRFVDRTRHVDETREVSLLVPPNALGAVIRWQDAASLTVDVNELQSQPECEAIFAPVPPQLNTASKLKAIEKEFVDYLYREQVLNLPYLPTLKLYAEPGESERDFIIRAQQLARENRDAEVEKLRQKYQQKLDRLQDQLAREERELSQDRAEYEARKREELLSAGETVIGMLGVFGRRRSTTALSRAATKRRLTASAQADIKESEEQIARLQAEINNLRREMEQEAEALSQKWASVLDQIATYAVRPARGGVQAKLVALAWTPYWEIGYTSASGSLTHDHVPAWR